MKKYYYILASLTLMAGLYSCQSNEEEMMVEEITSAVRPSSDVQVTFTAEFPQAASTRTQLYDTNVAWTSGDKIKVYPISSAGGYYTPADFTTSMSGFSADFTGTISSSIMNQAVKYYAFYPNDKVVSLYSNPSAHFNLPTTQTATPNSFAEELNFSYAETTDIYGKMTFKNACALISFKLGGSAVNDIKKVKFAASNDLTGRVAVNLDDGSITGIYSGSAYVELTGDFSSNTTYYMVVAPATLENGFTMSFFNEAGQEYTKKGLNAVTLQASHILQLGTIDVESSAFISGLIIPYKLSTKTKGVPMVVLPEGFTSDQLDDFHSKATEMLDFLFQVDPYKEYANYFNVYMIDAASNESGADVYDTGVEKDTYFDVGWSSNSYSDMKADEGIVFSFVESHCPDIVNGKATIDETAIFIIINDERYGGRCYSTNLGRGYAMIPLTSGGGSITWAGMSGYKITNTGTWVNTGLHEGGGHMFGRLADEYYTSYRTINGEFQGHAWSLPFGLNVTTNSAGIWSEFIPTTQGVKETGKFLYTGVYRIGENIDPTWGLFRSEPISCMDDNRAYFSARQRYLIAKRIHDIAGESFDYNTFISEDDQYAAIQAGVANRGKEGLGTTTYNGLVPNYGGGNQINTPAVDPSTIAPPLPPPVFTIIPEPEDDGEEWHLITID